MLQAYIDHILSPEEVIRLSKFKFKVKIFATFKEKKHTH